MLYAAAYSSVICVICAQMLHFITNLSVSPDSAWLRYLQWFIYFIKIVRLHADIQNCCFFLLYDLTLIWTLFRHMHFIISIRLYGQSEQLVASFMLLLNSERPSSLTGCNV